MAATAQGSTVPPSPVVDDSAPQPPAGSYGAAVPSAPYGTTPATSHRTLSCFRMESRLQASTAPLRIHITRALPRIFISNQARVASRLCTRTCITRASRMCPTEQHIHIRVLRPCNSRRWPAPTAPRRLASGRLPLCCSSPMATLPRWPTPTRQPRCLRLLTVRPLHTERPTAVHRRSWWLRPPCRVVLHPRFFMRRRRLRIMVYLMHRSTLRISSR